jgi:transposase
MTARRYQPTLNRQQEMLLPSRVDDYVGQNNTVRAIDAYVNTLNLQELGFKYTAVVLTAGQPPFNPAALLKLYLYGYLQGIRSSRKLEREICRNLEVIWLVEGLSPTYKTIADFRKDNSVALKAANRDFLLLCKELALFGGTEVAVDGSFFNADASKAGIYTDENLNKQLADLEKKIADYQQALAEQDARDDQAGTGSLVEDAQLANKIKRLQEKQTEKKKLQEKLQHSDSKQISTVDADARLLTKRGQTVAGYNVQIAVDSKHKLIVAEEVTQDGNDTQQLAPMLEKAQEILQSEELKGIADAGYFSATQIKTSVDQGIEVYVPVPQYSSSAQKQGRFGLDQFPYDAEQNHYTCPQGHTLLPGENLQKKDGKNVLRYRSQTSDCAGCPLREQCLTSKAKIREIFRWEHQEAIDAHKKRMADDPAVMKRRGALVEHPFGTLKHRAGMNHFLMRGLEKCRGEFSLMVLGYNFTRVLNILGVNFLRDYCAQRQENSLKSVKYA